MGMMRRRCDDSHRWLLALAVCGAIICVHLATSSTRDASLLRSGRPPLEFQARRRAMHVTHGAVSQRTLSVTIALAASGNLIAGDARDTCNHTGRVEGVSIGRWYRSIPLRRRGRFRRKRSRRPLRSWSPWSLAINGVAGLHLARAAGRRCGKQCQVISCRFAYSRSGITPEAGQ